MRTVNKYNEGINFLRAASILGVVFYHIFPFAMKGGFLGVCFFFLISGYLCAKKGEADWTADVGWIKEYYVKRAKRIYPALYIMVVSIVAIFTLFYQELLLGAREEAASIFLGYNNWWQMMTQASYFMKITEHSPFTHLWYMGVEIQLLVLWPILYGIYRRLICPRFGKKSIWFFVLLFVLSAVAMGVLYQGDNVNRVYYGTDTRAFSFFAGVCLGIGEDEWRQRKPDLFSGLWGRILFSIMLIVMLVMFFGINGESAWLYRGGMAAISLFFGLLLFVMNQCGFADSIWSRSRILHWIGKHSYLIYLWHYPLLFLSNLSGLL